MHCCARPWATKMASTGDETHWSRRVSVYKEKAAKKSDHSLGATLATDAALRMRSRSLNNHAP